MKIMNKKINILTMAVVALDVVLLCFVGFSYAYFTVYSTGNVGEKNLVVSTMVVSVENTPVDSLDPDNYYLLESYSCTDPSTTVSWSRVQQKLTVSSINGSGSCSVNMEISDKVYLLEEILSDNTEYDASKCSGQTNGSPNVSYAGCTSGINYGAINGTDNGNGLFYTSVNTEDTCPAGSNCRTYFFRGNVTNNYVKFADLYWKIIRINEDESIRMIYVGPTTTSNGQVGTSAYNTMVGDNAFVGYMYGTPTTYMSTPGSWSSTSSCWATGTIGTDTQTAPTNGTTCATGVYDADDNKCHTCANNYTYDPIGGKCATTVQVAESYTFNTTTGKYTLTNPEASTYNVQNGYYCVNGSPSECIRMAKIISVNTAWNSGTQYCVSSVESYAGYFSTSYSQAHANEVDSTIKTSVDQFYRNSLLNYSEYIADPGYCNDRSTTNAGFGREQTYYGAYNRNATSVKTPQFKCPNANNDLFTLKDNAIAVTNGATASSFGNKALEYPIALISSDEVAFSGGKYQTSNSNYYLLSNYWWSISPYRNFLVDPWGNAFIWYIYSSGTIGYDNTRKDFHIRPVISLKSTTVVESSTADGTTSKPYIVVTE